jgi:hypothetical protein
MKETILKYNEGFTLQGTSSSTDLKQYLNELDKYLTELGFKKYHQNHKQEDFAYWKKYDDKYQIGLLVYDFTKYDQYNLKKKVRIQFEAMPIDINGRCDLTVSKEIELPEFEKMAKVFYEAMIEYCY